jgi:hypothetical protein
MSRWYELYEPMPRLVVRILDEENWMVNTQNFTSCSMIWVVSLWYKHKKNRRLRRGMTVFLYSTFPQLQQSILLLSRT